jgi:hypothetical protein
MRKFCWSGVIWSGGFGICEMLMSDVILNLGLHFCPQHADVETHVELQDTIFGLLGHLIRVEGTRL